MIEGLRWSVVSGVERLRECLFGEVGEKSRAIASRKRSSRNFAPASSDTWDRGVDAFESPRDRAFEGEEMCDFGVDAFEWARDCAFEGVDTDARGLSPAEDQPTLPRDILLGVVGVCSDESEV